MGLVDQTYRYCTQPQEPYFDLLDRIRQHLVPRTYVEIGIAPGRSLTLALPGTRDIGIDPEPRVAFTLTRQTRVFSLSSDEFFAEHLHRLPADWNTVRTRLPAQPWRSDNVERFKEQRLAQALWPALGRGVQRAQRKLAQHHRTVSTASATR